MLRMSNGNGLISGDSFRPDILIILLSNYLYVVKLTMNVSSPSTLTRFENVGNILRSILALRSQYNKFLLLNLSIGPFGVMTNSSKYFWT